MTTALLARPTFGLGLSRTLRRQPARPETAVVYGAGETSRQLVAALQEAGVEILGVFDDRSGDRATQAGITAPVMGRLEELVALSRKRRIDTVVIALPVTAEARLGQIVKELAVLPVDIRVPATSLKLRLSPKAYVTLGGLPMIAIADKPISGWGAFAKAALDKTIAAAALVLLAPVLAGVAIAVRLDSRGPVLFRQKRYGFNNELIEVYKFRSMYTDMTDANARKLVTKDDPRVTRVGRFIRKTSLDELPQLLNVLTGQLSLVGPRPHAVAASAAGRLYPEVVDGYFARHKVKPGITGWAQINGWRGETDTEEKIRQRVAHDLAYIEGWSVLLDLYILAKTPLSLLKTENAY